MFPERKQNRLKNYDYSTNGAYFITICVNNQINLLWENEFFSTGENIKLSDAGIIVDKAINNIHVVYPNVQVDKYTIMPNHIHMILLLLTDWRPMVAPTISQVVNQMKGYATKHIGKAIWQKSFHDHIIRNECDYLEIWEYININPLKWRDDNYYQLE
jgi:putative transposase